jgi:hypothetical protein
LPDNARVNDAAMIEPPRAKLAADHLADRLAVIVAGPMTPPRHAVNGRSITCATQTNQTTTLGRAATEPATLEPAGISHR